MAFDLVTVVNMVLAMIICGVGIFLNYTRSRSMVYLYTGIGFGLFAISHAIVLAGQDAALAFPLVVIRIAGYLIVLFGLLYRGPDGAKGAFGKPAGGK